MKRVNEMNNLVELKVSSSLIRDCVSLYYIYNRIVLRRLNILRCDSLVANIYIY